VTDIFLYAGEVAPADIKARYTDAVDTGAVSGPVAKSLANGTVAATGVVANAGSVIATLGNATAAGNVNVNPQSLPLSWMPQISLGKPIFGTGSVSKLIDGAYFYDTVTPGAWACVATDYAAINLGSGPKKILVAIGSDQAITSTGQYVNAAAFEAYRFQVSNNSTNGVDGSWTTVVTVTGNTFTTREHLIDFTGWSWIKLIMDTVTGGRIDELDVWDATGGTENTFAFVGDSLTVRGTSRESYGGGGKLPSFQQVFQTNRGFYPLMVSLGVTGRDAAGLAADIGALLTAYPDVKYWIIGMGTNNGAGMPAQLATYIASMTTTINAITAAGRVPILGRVPYTDAAGYGGNTSPDPSVNGLKYLNDNGINALVASLGVRSGADLFQPFYDNRVAWGVIGDPHFNDDGVRGWADLWATNVGKTGSGGVSFPTLGDATLAAAGTVTAGVTGTVAKTLDDATLQASGGPPTGNLALTLGNGTLAAAGTHVPSVTGSLAVTLANAGTAAAGTRAAALRMDAVADSLKLGTNPTSSTSYTALGWAKIRVDRNNYSGIFVVENSGASQFQELMTDVDGTSLKVFDHVGLNLTVGTMVVDTYHKVAISVSGTTVSAYFGTMGTPGLTKVTGTIGAVTTIATFGIGSSSVSEWLNGLVEGVRVYNAVLSDSEIALEFTSKTAVRTSNLLVDTIPPGITSGNELVSLTGSNLLQFVAGTPAYTLEGGPVLDTLITGSVANNLGDVTSAATGSFTSGSVTGTVGVTLGNTTSAASGSEVVGSSAQTLAAATLAATGSFTLATVTGTTAATLANGTMAAAGSEVVGSTAVSLANSTASATGAHGAAGTAAATLGNTTSAAAGSGTIGTVAKTMADATLVASGSFTGTSISGTVAVTLANAAIAASGSEVVGSVVQSLASTTSAVAGVHGVSGSVARTLADGAVSAAGSEVVGSLAKTGTNATLAASGAHGVTGTEAATLANGTLAAAGTFTPAGVSGSVAVTLANAAATASGSEVVGSVAQTGAGTTLAAAGTFTLATVTGSVAQTLANSTAAAAGSETIGSTAVTGANTTLAATGSFTASGVIGSVAVTGANVTSAASGSETIGSLAKTLGDSTSAASGARGASGVAAITLAGATASAAGSEVVGSTARVLADATLVGAGNFTPAGVSGTVATTLQSVAGAASGVHGVSGSVARTMASATSAATGAHGVAGTVSKALSDVVAAAAGSSVSGSAAPVLGSASVSAAGALGVTGSINKTLANVVSSAVGSSNYPGISGSVAETLDNMVVKFGWGWGQGWYPGIDDRFGPGWDASMAGQEVEVVADDWLWEPISMDSEIVSG
jgi:hypothetical protein